MHIDPAGMHASSRLRHVGGMSSSGARNHPTLHIPPRTGDNFLAHFCVAPCLSFDRFRGVRIALVAARAPVPGRVRTSGSDRKVQIDSGGHGLSAALLLDSLELI